MSSLTTAVILARGLGSRMRAGDGADLRPDQAAAAASGAKAMMPTGGRPFLDYSLSALADAGITDVILVVPPQHDAFRAHVDALELTRLSVSFAVQDEPRGTADAVAAAEEAVDGRRFVMVNGDNLYAPDAIARFREHDGCGVLGYDKAALVALSNISAERIAAYAIIEERDGVLVDIVEKPDAAFVDAAGPHALVSMNAMAFTPIVFEACRSIAPSARGEYECVDAVRWIAAREPVRVPRVESGCLDLSNRGDIASVEDALARIAVRL